MITVIIAAISIYVAGIFSLPSFIVLIQIIMIAIVAIIVTLVSSCIMNVTILTASLSIPAPVLLSSLLLLVRVPSSAQ